MQSTSCENVHGLSMRRGNVISVGLNAIRRTMACSTKRPPRTTLNEIRSVAPVVAKLFHSTPTLPTHCDYTLTVTTTGGRDCKLYLATFETVAVGVAAPRGRPEKDTPLECNYDFAPEEYLAWHTSWARLRRLTTAQSLRKVRSPRVTCWNPNVSK
jgi:hypothetical protein